MSGTPIARASQGRHPGVKLVAVPKLNHSKAKNDDREREIEREREKEGTEEGGSLAGQGGTDGRVQSGVSALRPKFC